MLALLCCDRRVRHVMTRHKVTSPSFHHDRQRCIGRAQRSIGRPRRVAYPIDNPGCGGWYSCTNAQAPHPHWRHCHPRAWHSLGKHLAHQPPKVTVPSNQISCTLDYTSSRNLWSWNLTLIACVQRATPFYDHDTHHLVTCGVEI
jgi:hypothetical protein